MSAFVRSLSEQALWRATAQPGKETLRQALGERVNKGVTDAPPPALNGLRPDAAFSRARPLWRRGLARWDRASARSPWMVVPLCAPMLVGAIMFGSGGRGEPLTAFNLAGGAIQLAGIALAWWGVRRATGRHAASPASIAALLATYSPPIRARVLDEHREWRERNPADTIALGRIGSWARSAELDIERAKPPEFAARAAALRQDAAFRP